MLKEINLKNKILRSTLTKNVLKFSNLNKTVSSLQSI